MSITDHPNFNTIQAFVDNAIIKIRNKQADYFVAKKKYFQGLKIPSQGKLNGKSDVDIDYGLHPSDQEDSWNAFDKTNFKANVKFPIHLTCHVYESPDGWGYILKFELWEPSLGPDKYGNDGDHWIYQINEGPEVRSGIWNDWYVRKDEGD